MWDSEIGLLPLSHKTAIDCAVRATLVESGSGPVHPYRNGRALKHRLLIQAILLISSMENTTSSWVDPGQLILVLLVGRHCELCAFPMLPILYPD